MTTTRWLQHWQLNRDPFSKEIDDAELWLPSSKLAVVERLVDTMTERGSVLLVGEPGVGKTCVLRALRHRLPEAGFRLTYCHNALRERGCIVGRHRVARLMRAHGIAAPKKRRWVKTTDSSHDLPVAPNLLNRDFTAPHPDTRWVGDISYIATDEGWLFLAVVLDLFSRRVVGWGMADNMRTPLVTDALRMAVEQRNVAPGLMFHSDRGSQYASRDYQAELTNHGMTCSMSRRGECWDNAAMESFFGTLKQELVYRTSFSTRQEAKAAIFEYIEVFYNRQRLHSALDYVSPDEYEMRRANVLLAA